MIPVIVRGVASAQVQEAVSLPPTVTQEVEIFTSFWFGGVGVVSAGEGFEGNRLQLVSKSREVKAMIFRAFIKKGLKSKIGNREMIWK